MKRAITTMVLGALLIVGLNAVRKALGEDGGARGYQRQWDLDGVWQGCE